MSDKRLRKYNFLFICKISNKSNDNYNNKYITIVKHKLESGLLGEISITSDMQMTPPLWQKVKRNSKAS